MDTFFEFNSYGTTRGHSLKLIWKKRASTSLRNHFFSERVINNWNNLDNKTVTSGSINICKGNLERLRQSKEIDLFVGNWWYLIFWGVPSVRPRQVSFPVSFLLLRWASKSKLLLSDFKEPLSLLMALYYKFAILLLLVYFFYYICILTQFSNLQQEQIKIIIICSKLCFFSFYFQKTKYRDIPCTAVFFPRLIPWTKIWQPPIPKTYIIILLWW